MSQLQNRQRKASRVNEILNKLRSGQSREAISDHYGYSTWKSLDMYMRRNGFTWDSQRRIYTNAEAGSTEGPSLASTDLTEINPDEIIRLFGLGILDAREIAKKTGFPSHKDMAAFMGCHGYVWSSAESNYMDSNPPPQEQSLNNMGKNEDTLAKAAAEHSRSPLTEGFPSDKYITLLEFLWNSRDKLIKMIESTEELQNHKVQVYTIPGEAKTKSIFFSNELATLMTAFCKDHCMSQKQGFEAALIEYLAQHGYEHEINSLLQKVH
ncbi:Hypothetical protein DPCES_3545 [Desulfitobacterium hafniense]|uniref:Uncharacterized protein n=1 Tax=Desulfitobacterium hafniense TaxID=49338 RepID=A0A098B6C7_DESHA|nr:hypothetical protein [Desulfitobacterium hafniense]CDX03431.1 Hypothetical protein DPCES_3545 [Desulfitobacterium hafniense]